MSKEITIRTKFDPDKVNSNRGVVYVAGGSTIFTSNNHSAVTLGTANGLSLNGQTLSLNLATDTSAGAMSSEDKTKLNGIIIHPAVDLGTANGLSLSGQTLSLDLASTSSSGAMSAADKIFLNNLSSNLFTLKSNGVEDGVNINQGNTVIIQGSDNVQVLRSGSTLTISADTSSGGITTLSGGIGIDVTGTGNSRTISAKIDNDTIIIDELNNQMKVDSSKYATSSHLHTGVYEPVFSKNTGFNKNFGTTSGTVAEGNDSRFHEPVTLGIKTNGLSLSGQTLSLSLALTSSSGAMSAADKTFLNNLSSNLFTLKSNGVEDGVNITAGNTVIIQGSDNVQVSRSGSTLTISADTSSGGITTLSGGIGIDVTGSGSSRTVSAKIDNDTIIIDELNNQMMVDSSKLAVASANSNGAMSAAHYNIVNNLPSTFMGGSGTSGRVARFTPNGSTLGNSSIYDNGTNIGVGASQNTTNKIYASQTSANPTIRGYNASTSSGSAGVNGEANGSGQGYLSRYDGTRRAAIYGIVGSGSGTKYAGYFSGDVLTTGDVYSNSDKRLKKNVEEIERPLERLKEVNPVKFNWKHDKTEKVNYGVIAQDLQKSFPELVSNDGAYLTVRYQEFIGVLIASIKEQDKRIEKLEKQLKRNGTSHK